MLPVIGAGRLMLPLYGVGRDADFGSAGIRDHLRKAAGDVRGKQNTAGT
jgi:hypothetical protein